MQEKNAKKEDISQDDDFIIDFVAGDLVTPIRETSGILEKCWWPENIDKTIRPWDNVKIPENTIGMVVGFIANYHTCMAIVAWGGSLGGKKLVTSANRLKKATKLEATLQKNT